MRVARDGAGVLREHRQRRPGMWYVQLKVRRLARRRRAVEAGGAYFFLVAAFFLGAAFFLVAATSPGAQSAQQPYLWFHAVGSSPHS